MIRIILGNFWKQDIMPVNYQNTFHTIHASFYCTDWVRPKSYTTTVNDHFVFSIDEWCLIIFCNLNGNVSCRYNIKSILSGFIDISVIYPPYPSWIHQQSLITQFVCYYVNTCDYPDPEEAIQKIKTPTDMAPEEKVALL